MIKSIHYRNYKALRDAVLPLGRFTLILGPNASGKSTAMQALQATFSETQQFSDIVSGDLNRSDKATVSVAIEWTFDDQSLGVRKSNSKSSFVEPVISRRNVTLESTWQRRGSTILVQTYPNSQA